MRLCGCRNKKHLDGTSLIFSLVDSTPWHTVDVVTGSAALPMREIANLDNDQSHSFTLPLTSGGRVVGEVSGTIELDDGAAVMLDDADNVVQQIDPEAFSFQMSAAPGLAEGGGVGGA